MLTRKQVEQLKEIKDIAHALLCAITDDEFTSYNESFWLGEAYRRMEKFHSNNEGWMATFIKIIEDLEEGAENC